LHFLAPENDLIPIDRVRELASRLQLTAFEGRFKIAIIAGAHRMNPAAQNALLKTLEEPPGSAVLVLLASAPHLLLPTVRSRCQILGFAPLPEAFVRERLAEATGRAGDDAEIALAATLSEGSLGRALQIAGQGLYGDRGELVETVQRLSPGAPSAALDLAAAWSEDRAKASEALEILQLWYRDRALAAAGASGEDRPPALPEIPVVAPLPLAGALGALGLLHEARRGLRGNANAQLLLERTFLALARIQGDA
jgi:DNA polymerase-3 subunit delta'